MAIWLKLSKVILRKFQVSEKILNFHFFTYFLTEYFTKVGNTEVTNQRTTVHTVPQVYSFLSKIQGAQILISMTFKPSKMSKFWFWPISKSKNWFLIKFEGIYFCLFLISSTLHHFLLSYESTFVWSNLHISDSVALKEVIAQKESVNQQMVTIKQK